MESRPIDDGGQPAGIWLTIGLLLTFALIAAAHNKGGYIDEYWTMSFADSSVPLRRAFQAWSMETGHPIGFYAISRLGDLILPVDLFARRLTNLLFFGAALVGALRIQESERRSFGLLYVATVAATPYSVERFAEYRAIFLALMLASLLVLQLRVIFLRAAPRRRDGAAVIILIGFLALTNYPIALVGLALCGAWCLFSIIDRDLRGAVAAAAGVITGTLVIGLSLLNTARFPMYPSPYFQSFSGLIRDLAVVTATAILPCIAILGFFFARLRRGTSERQAFKLDRFSWLLIVSIALTLVGYILFNAATHSLIRRQLFGIIPLVVALALNVAWPYLGVSRKGVGLIGLNLLIVAGSAAFLLKSKVYMDRFGPQIAHAQRACPSLPVYAVLPERLTGDSDNRFPMPDQVAIAFSDIARRHGIRVRENIPARWVDERCGAIIWSEYLWMNGRPTSQIIAGKLELEQPVPDAAEIDYVDQSMLMQVPPPR